MANFNGGKYHSEFPDVEISYEVEELEFTFSVGYQILVWTKGNIYKLSQAYEQGLLTKANLIIHMLYYNS